MNASRLGILSIFVLLLAAPIAKAAQSTAFVFTTDFSTGSLSAVNLATRGVSTDVGSEVCADATLRWFDGRLYVVNRSLGCDNVVALDPANGYSVARQFSTGNGSNPHDIVFVSATKAYVTRYDRASLMIANPTSGADLGEISLAAFADADGIPEMDRMIRIGDRVFVSVQRLDRNNGYQPTDASLIVVIDATADTVVDVDPDLAGRQAIVLTGRDPVTTFSFDRVSGRLLVGCVGRFGQLDGGIEWIDPVALRSDGFAITEAVLGGDIGDVAWNGAAHSYAIVSDASFNSALVSWNTAGVKLGTVFRPGGFSLADCEVNDRNELYVCDNDFFAPGLFVFSTLDDQVVAGPLNTGLPPYQVTFDQANDAVAGVPQIAPRLALAIQPNPTHGPARLTFAVPAAMMARLEVIDAAGRRLRAWTLGGGVARSNEVRWDLRDASGSRVPQGIYFARLQLGQFSVVRRMIVMY